MAKDALLVLLRISLLTGVLTRDHVMYQMMLKFLSRVWGIDDDSEHSYEKSFRNLKKFGLAVMNTAGASVVNLLRGRGGGNDPASICDNTNTGFYSSVHLARYRPVAQVNNGRSELVHCFTR